jgi:outer membrane lipoprotein-sorting protein
MSFEMNHELARVELSARMDSEIDGSTALALDRHLETCAACRAYGERLHELRRSLRLEPLESAPDLAPAVMSAIASGRVAPREVFKVRLRIASVAAAATALLLVTTILPLDRAPTATANAAEIERAVTSAAKSLTTYHAIYDISELGWHPSIPSRRFEAEVWYRSPEDFRLRVRDLTRYPSKAWPANDVDLIANPQRYWIKEPYSCPTEALPGCSAGSGVEERSIVRRQPFDGSSDAPTDIVVPLESVARSEGLETLGETTIDGRKAEHVRLTYREARPLVDALQAGGTWAPIAPLDSVDIWLDGETWFPLRFTVSDGTRRVLDVTARSVDEPPSLDDDLFRAPRRGVVVDGGFVRSSKAVAGYVVVPGYAAGLRPYRAGTIESGPRVTTYAGGMTWLKVVESDSVPQGLSSLEAEVVTLVGGGRALYMPADSESGRRVDVDDGTLHYRIESNLTRPELLKVAASLPITGSVADVVRVPGGTLRRLAEIPADLSYAERAGYLPTGYRLTGVFRRTGERALIVRYALPEAEYEGAGIRIDQSPDITHLPPSSEDLFGVKVGNALGRWSQERGQLEWIDGDVYRSITAPSFDLGTVLRIAAELR